jgi:hypothetical protein
VADHLLATFMGFTDELAGFMVAYEVFAVLRDSVPIKAN